MTYTSVFKSLSFLDPLFPFFISYLIRFYQIGLGSNLLLFHFKVKSI